MINKMYPVSYYSWKFDKQYSIIEKKKKKKELALISSLDFEIYVAMWQPHTVIFMDHNPLVFIDKIMTKNRPLAWSLALQVFNLKIKHISGVESKCANALSHI